VESVRVFVAVEELRTLSSEIDVISPEFIQIERRCAGLWPRSTIDLAVCPCVIV